MVCELLQSAGADGTSEDNQFVTPQDLSVRAGVDFIIASDSNPITLKDLRQARIRVDPGEFPVIPQIEEDEKNPTGSVGGKTGESKP